MPVSTLSTDDKPEDVLDEHVHCRTTLQADPLSAALATPFDGLITDWKQTNTARIDLEITLYQAVATAFYADTQLNTFVDKLALALLEITGGDRSKPEWFVYFQGVDPYTFKRPILAGQLQKMSQWPASLAASPHQALVDLGPGLVPLLASGTTAEQAVQAARQALLTFDNVGKWRQHVDQSNSARATAYGSLLEIPHQNPALKLPSDYAEKFFLHDTSRRGASKPKTPADIASEIDATKAKLVQLEAALKEATEREQAAAAAQVQRQEKEKELAAAKQQEKEAKEKKKALEKQLGKKK